MKLVTPPQNQGQTVEVSYGWHQGSLYRHVLDRSDRSIAWYVADQDQADALEESWHPVNSEPTITTWIPCQDPDPA